MIWSDLLASQCRHAFAKKNKKNKKLLRPSVVIMFRMRGEKKKTKTKRKKTQTEQNKSAA